MRVMAGALEGDLFIGPKAEVTYGACLSLGLGSSVIRVLGPFASVTLGSGCEVLYVHLPSVRCGVMASLLGYMFRPPHILSFRSYFENTEEILIIKK